MFSGVSSTPLRTRILPLLAFVAAIPLSPAPGLAQSFPGGFIEKATSTAVRPRLTRAEIQAFLPARGKFTFPSPWLTEGIRLTNDTDCGGTDCVSYVGYSYWRNINNHVGSDTMLILLSLRGNGGPTLFSYNKVTEMVTNLGPVFDATSPFSSHSGEGWYFSATQPTKLYVPETVGPKLLRYDVSTRTFETVFDASLQFGTDKYIWQAHSSDDDRVHSATLRDRATFAMLGCMAYRGDTNQFFFYPALGAFDECQVDRSGRWLLIKENVDGAFGEDNRIIDLTTGVETVLIDQNGAGGHSDNGHSYMVAADNWYSLPGAARLWKFGQDPLQGSLVYHTTNWSVDIGHFSHTNAKSGVAPEAQYGCSSNASRLDLPRANEIICYRLDTSLDVLVVAPVMTNLDAPGGGDDYSKLPKGNLDVTGRYFIWTSNTASNRLDAFIVKVPAQLLTDTTAPTVSITAPVSGATLAGTVTVSASATDDVGVVGVQFQLDGANLGAEVTATPYSIPWVTTSAVNGSHILRALARDAAGNVSTSPEVSVTVANGGDTTPPTVAITSPVGGATVSGTITVSATAFDNVGVAGVQFRLDGVNLGVEVTTAPYSVSWNTTTAPDGAHTLTAVARDAAGNSSMSAPVAVTVKNDATPPVISGVSASNISSSGATITWVTNEPSDSQVEYGPTTAYGSSTTLNASMVTSHSQTLTGLAPGTLYHYRVKSRDAAGNLATSTDFTFTTRPDLVGYWKFDEGGGTTATDSSGNGNTGTLTNGPKWTGGRINQALSFDGVDDYVNVPHTSALNAYPLSVAVWVKTKTTGLKGIVNKYFPSSFNGYQVFANSGNLCAWYFRDASNYIWDGSGCTLMTPGYTDNLWHHVVFVVDASGGRLYVDGVQKASRGWTGTPGAASTSLNLNFARYPGTAQPYLRGLLDEVRIYSRALSAQEISSLYSAGSDTTPPTVSITSPTGGATVSGTITISATASDNVGVAGVQFRLDGVNLGAEVTTPPYSVSWNTTTALNGAHTLTAVVRDAAGNSTVSGPVAVTVNNDTTPPAISAVSASNISSSGATITWTTDEASDSQVEYGLTTAYGSVTALNTSMVTTHSQTLSGLTASTLYHYRVKSKDATGNLAVSGDFTFTTLAPPDTTPPTISAVTTSGITSTGVTITWTTNEASDSQVEYGLTTAYGSSTLLNTTLVTAHSEPLSGLAASTLYHYRVKSRDAAGNLAVSADFTFTTAASSPSVENVIWTNLVNVTATGNSIQKTGGCDGCADAGATSQQQITSGDGFVEFTASEIGALRFAGLSTGNAGTGPEEIKFAIRLQSGIAEVRESGVYRADTTFVSGDVFRVAVQSGIAKYYKNGALFYTSTAIPSYPLLMDTSIFNLNGTISNALISRAQ